MGRDPQMLSIYPHVLSAIKKLNAIRNWESYVLKCFIWKSGGQFKKYHVPIQGQRGEKEKEWGKVKIVMGA